MIALPPNTEVPGTMPNLTAALGGRDSEAAASAGLANTRQQQQQQEVTAFDLYNQLQGCSTLVTSTQAQLHSCASRDAAAAMHPSRRRRSVY